MERNEATCGSLLQAITSTAVLCVNVSGVITVFNRGAELMFGYREHEVRGRMRAEDLHLPEQVAERLQELIKQRNGPATFHDLVVNSGPSGMPEATEWTFVRNDGTRFEGSLTVNALSNEAGRCIAYVGVIQDISDQLQQKLYLGKAVRAAESASRAKSEFLAAMSHEIRTPMNGILGMAGLLLQSELTQRQRGRVETLRNSAEALLAVLNDILDFSKLEAGKLELEVADFDLRKVVEDVSDLLAVKAQEKDLEVLCFIEPAVPTRLQGDANRLRQILINLMGNAVKFTQAGSVALSVRMLSGRDCNGHENMLEFRIADTGPGIPADKQHLLFHPFSQVDASMARRHGGTGLGLSIVASLVKILGGRVGFESEAGRGSTFWFTASLLAQPEVKRPNALSLSGRRLLVVDDSEASRTCIGRYLRHWKCISDMAASAGEAMLKLRSGNGRYDAILTDLKMPQMSGAELAEEIHADQDLKHIPIIVMTDLESAHDTAYWQQRYFIRRVTKPLKQGDLGGALAFAMGYRPLESSALVKSPQRQEKREKRSGARLLLVEDNPVNREVALGILEHLGYEADVACDGRIALSLLSKTRYAAILTDCNLPELDGYELTRMIRDPDTNVADHNVPIIAMTAHALAGDREKCLQAGMDDYIAKPINARLLEELLDRYVVVPKSASPVTSPLPAPLTSLNAAFDRDDLVERLMGNEGLARRVAGSFLAEMPSQLASLAQALDSHGASNMAQIRDLAHSLKGAAANVSGAPLSAAARKLEEAAAVQDLARSRDCLEEVAAEFEQAKAAIDHFLAHPANVP